MGEQVSIRQKASAEVGGRMTEKMISNVNKRNTKNKMKMQMNYHTDKKHLLYVEIIRTQDKLLYL